MRLTSDGEVIVMHDSNAYRTTGVDENIANMTYKEVRRLDAGSWYSEQYKGEKVPSLREVLELTQGKIKLNIELKPAGNGDELAKKTAALIEKYNMTAEEIDKFCLELPRYKRPKEIIFAEIPRNATGKIEKPKLRKIYGADRLVAQENQG